MNERNRIIDIAKGLGMIFVVLFHADIIPEMWSQFHMPLFAFLSGVFYHSKNNDSIKRICSYAIKKIKCIYIPFVVYNFIFLCFHNIFYKFNIYSETQNAIYYSIDNFISKAISIITLGGGENLSGPLWYLIAMLEFTLLYPVIRMLVKKFKPKKQEIVVTIICIGFLIVGYSSIGFPRMLNKAFVLLIFYHVGFITKNHREFLLHQRSTLINIVCIVILIFGFFSGVNWHFFTMFSLPCGLAGIWLTMVISSCLDRKFKFNKVILFIGQHTMFILATHLLWFKIVTFLFLKVYHYDISFLGTPAVPVGIFLVWRFIYFVFGLGIPILLVFMKERVVEKCKIKLLR